MIHTDQEYALQKLPEGIKKKRYGVMLNEKQLKWVKSFDPIEGSLARGLAVIFKKAGFKKDEPRRAK